MSERTRQLGVGRRSWWHTSPERVDPLGAVIGGIFILVGLAGIVIPGAMVGWSKLVGVCCIWTGWVTARPQRRKPWKSGDPIPPGRLTCSRCDDPFCWGCTP